MKQEKQKQAFSFEDSLFEQMTHISKAGAYDAIAPHYAELQAENARLKERVKFLEDLITEYTNRMTANLSGPKVDQFLKSQLFENDPDDLKNISL